MSSETTETEDGIGQAELLCREVESAPADDVEADDCWFVTFGDQEPNWIALLWSDREAQDDRASERLVRSSRFTTPEVVTFRVFCF